MRICCQDLIDANDGDDVESLHDRGLHWGACHETVDTLDGHSSERGNGGVTEGVWLTCQFHSSTVNIHRWVVGIGGNSK